MDYEELRKHYSFDSTCQGSCPQAIYCFLISKDFEDCIRTTVSIGGDTDTLCAMSCAIAEAYYKNIPESITEKINKILPEEMLKIIKEFSMVYGDIK